MNYNQILQSIEDLCRQHELAVESLTRNQLADAIRQALASGDFCRHVSIDHNRQTVTYIPYAAYSQLRVRYDELLAAVANVIPGESRHDTALRYIREREQEGVTMPQDDTTGNAMPVTHENGSQQAQGCQMGKE